MSKIKVNKAKRFNYLWALAGIPIILGGTIAVSCAPISSGEQIQEDDYVAGIKWDALYVKEQYSGMYADAATTKDLIQMVQWDSNVNLNSLSIDSIKEVNKEEGKITAIFLYNSNLVSGVIRGFAKYVPPTDVPDETKHELLLSEFKDKIVLNNKGKTEINAEQVSKVNVGEYIDVFLLKDESSNYYYYHYKEASVRIYDLWANSNNTISINFLFSAFGIKTEETVVVSGFLSTKDYQYKEFNKYVSSYELRPRDTFAGEMPKMHATAIANERMFNYYFELNNSPKYFASVVAGTLRWTSLSSLSIDVKFREPGTSNERTRTLTYDKFKQNNENNLGSKVTQTIFNYDDIMFHIKKFEFINYDALRVDWNSLKTRQYLYTTTQNTALSLVKSSGIYDALLNGAKEYYTIEDSWNIQALLTQRSWDIIRDNRFDLALYIKGWPLWSDPVAYLRLWTPEFTLRLTNDKLPWLKHEFTIYLKHSNPK